ncbi:MAG: hypothetical protein ACFNTA_06210 [Campylobacter sp.]|uniref:hypothetical protein n=1 Tax=Campylobacter sp. TaxID=205 RepID=UPI00361CF885
MFFGFTVAKFVGFRSRNSPRNLILSVGDICVLNLTGRIFTANLSGNFQSWVRLGVKFDELRGSVAAQRG